MLASQSSLTTAACTAGMVAVAVPRRMAERGVYDGVRAKFSGENASHGRGLETAWC